MHCAAPDRIFEVADDQALAHLGRPPVAALGHFGEVVAGVHMQQREGQAAFVRTVCTARLEGLFGQPQHHARILAAREQQGGALERGHGFTQDEDGFLFEPVEVGVVEVGQQLLDLQWRIHAGTPISDSVEVSAAGASLTCRPHSFATSSSHHQRPARKSSPKAIARVQGAQPMLGKNWSCSGL